MVGSGCDRRLRVLCTSTGGAGHVNAVAQALLTAGHEIHWAAPRDGGDAVSALGFAWSPAGLTTTARRDAAQVDLANVMDLPMAHRRGPLFTALFVRAAAPVMRRDLASLWDHVKPDIVVRETAELAAAAMAASHDVPMVTVAFSGVLPESARPLVLAGLRTLWHAEGLEDPSWSDIYGDLYLHPFPPSFGQRPDTTSVQPLRPGIAATLTDSPPWVAALGRERKCIYVSSGTERPATTFPWKEVCRALGRLDVDAVATIGPHVEFDALGIAPSNVRVERFVPQAWVLPRSSVVVSHGGAGTVLGAAAHGRSQLVVPLSADQWENGLAVRDAGCGTLVEPDRRSSDDFESMIVELLDGTSYSAAAGAVAREISAMPTADALVGKIEALVNS